MCHEFGALSGNLSDRGSQIDFVLLRKRSSRAVRAGDRARVGRETGSEFQKIWMNLRVAWTAR
jgi:hypothetical protein